MMVHEQDCQSVAMAFGVNPGAGSQLGGAGMTQR
jgi:hypothetical protein